MSNIIFNTFNRTILLLFLILLFSNIIEIMLIHRSRNLMKMSTTAYVNLAAKSSALLAIQRNQIYYFFDPNFPNSCGQGKAYKEFSVTNENDSLFIEEFNRVMAKRDIVE